MDPWMGTIDGCVEKGRQTSVLGASATSSWQGPHSILVRTLFVGIR
jgi:hypothetical protein